MKNYLKLLFGDPNNKEELLNSEYIGIRLASIVCFLTSIYIFYVLLRRLNQNLFEKNLTLGILIVINGLAFLIFSIISHNKSKKVTIANSITDFEKLKLSLYKSYSIVIGIPYLYLSIWLTFVRDYKSTIIMLTIYFGTMLLGYLFDWKDYLKNKDKYSGFFE